MITPEFKKNLGSLYSYLATKLGIRQTPLLKFINDDQNSKQPFGFTGHYDPSNKTITLYITNRHNTDILRSFAHEVIHHWQNERGTLLNKKENPTNTEGQHTHYAQEDSWLRRREMEAYLFGNILFRDWQDEQRMGPPKISPTLPQPLDENLKIRGSGINPELQGTVLKNMVHNFVKDMVSTGVLTSYHRKLTSGDMQAKDFVEDLSHKILSSIEQWLKTINDRGNWENNEGGMIK